MQYNLSVTKNLCFCFGRQMKLGVANKLNLREQNVAFKFLQQLGLKVSVFVSDRHRGIAKLIREVCKETTHYYDIWHVAPSVTKKLLAASKEKGCEIIKEEAILYWQNGNRSFDMLQINMPTTQILSTISVTTRNFHLESGLKLVSYHILQCLMPHMLEVLCYSRQLQSQSNWVPRFSLSHCQ